MTKTSREAFEEWAIAQNRGIVLTRDPQDKQLYISQYTDGLLRAWKARDAEVAELRQQLEEANKKIGLYALCMNTGGIDELHKQLAAAQAGTSGRRGTLTPTRSQPRAAARGRAARDPLP